jgi:hypothetical protein
MTTTIKVTSHNYPALVRQVDRFVGPDAAGKLVRVEHVMERILRPEDGEQRFHCTTSRTIEVIDLDYADPRVLELAPVANDDA